jgi:hypothetical protein
MKCSCGNVPGIGDLFCSSCGKAVPVESTTPTYSQSAVSAAGVAGASSNMGQSSIAGCAYASGASTSSSTLPSSLSSGPIASVSSSSSSAQSPTGVAELFSRAVAECEDEIASCARRLKVRPGALCNLVADLEAADITSGCLRRGFLTQNTTFMAGGKNYEYTSCGASAVKIFKQITPAGPAASAGSGSVEQLAHAVQQNSQRGNCAIRVAFGSQHSFVIVFKGGKAEILQSFAGSAGAPLIACFSDSEEHRSFDRAELPALIAQMEDSAVQDQLFGGRVETDVGAAWEVKPLKPDDEIQASMSNNIRAGLQAVDPREKPPDTTTGKRRRTGKEEEKGAGGGI